jgi:hypothetical protein
LFPVSSAILTVVTVAVSTMFLLCLAVRNIRLKALVRMMAKVAAVIFFCFGTCVMVRFFDVFAFLGSHWEHYT